MRECSPACFVPRCGFSSFNRTFVLLHGILFKKKEMSVIDRKYRKTTKHCVFENYNSDSRVGIPSYDTILYVSTTMLGYEKTESMKRKTWSKRKLPCDKSTIF